MAIIDSQVHAYEANTPKRPWHSVPNWPDHVTGDEMVAAMDKVGVDGAIFISAFCVPLRRQLCGGSATGPSRPVRIVKPVDPDDPAVADVVADGRRRRARSKSGSCCRKRRGASRTTRVSTASCARPFVSIFRSTSCAGTIWTRALRSSIAIPTRDSSSTISASCSRACRPRRREPWADLPKVLELAKRPNAVIKVSGACTLSREPYPFPDIWDPLARVFDAWGFDRCLWGTDWTRAFAVVNYEQAVEPFLRTDRLSDTERAMLMGGACAKAYGWSPKKS